MGPERSVRLVSTQWRGFAARESGVDGGLPYLSIESHISEAVALGQRSLGGKIRRDDLDLSLLVGSCACYRQGLHKEGEECMLSLSLTHTPPYI